MSANPPALPERIGAHAHPAWLYRHPRCLRLVFGWYRLLYQRTWVTQRALNRALRRLPAGSKVLDAGCGEGLFLFRTARRFPQHRFVGGDVRPANLRLAGNFLSRSSLRNVRLAPMDLADLSSIPVAHLIYMVGVLHLLPDDRAALHHLRRRVEAGGRLLLYTPVHRRRVLPWFEAWYRRFANYEATHAQRVYTPAALCGLLRDSGWHIQSERYTNGTLGIIGYELYTGFFLLISAGNTGQRLLGLLLLIITLPLILALNGLDYLRRPERGNGVLITAVAAPVD